jgi:hypothetical protein
MFHYNIQMQLVMDWKPNYSSNCQENAHELITLHNLNLHQARELFDLSRVISFQNCPY